ncbi:MAG TPA: PhnD/SsuA/transferrin family substrate-binding protein [Myxococcales bacterium]|jgi:phosphonate transport system substrate-binding protein
MTTELKALRFAMPPSKGNRFVHSAPQLLELLLERTLAEFKPRVHSCPDYAALTAEVMAHTSEVAWAPPVLCAKVEQAGGLIVGRFERRGLGTYRSALVTSKQNPVALSPTSTGLRAVWVDPDSTAGYLLPRAHLHRLKIDPAHAFASEHFAKSFEAALEAVAQGQADLTAVYSTPSQVAQQRTALEDLPHGLKEKLQILRFTDEAPNDGIVVSPGQDKSAAAGIRDRLLAAFSDPSASYVLKQVFNADKIAPVLPHAYDALLRMSGK